MKRIPKYGVFTDRGAHIGADTAFATGIPPCCRLYTAIISVLLSNPGISKTKNLRKLLIPPCL